MASKVEKFCISLPGESLAQLDWIKENVLHCTVPMKRSQLIQMAIGLAYFKYQAESNNK